MITQKIELDSTPVLIGLTESATLFNKSNVGVRGGKAIALAITDGNEPDKDIHITLFADEDKYYEYVSGESLYAWAINEVATLIIG
jgi:hypothetical protein